ncbi:MAG: hypothetical protein AB9921_03830 [Erysipelotrichaceae bacterium]
MKRALRTRVRFGKIISIFTNLPMLSIVFYLILQKNILKGISEGALKQ